MKPLTLIAPGCATIAVTYGLARYSYGLFLPEIRASLDISLSILSLIASGSYAGYIVAIWISILLTPYVEARWLIIFGSISATMGTLMVALAHNQWLLAIGILLAGTGSGWAYPAIPEIVSSSIPPNKQGIVLAWINSGTSFGVMLSGPIAIWSAELWRPAWLVFSFLSFLTTYWNFRILPRQKLKHKGGKPLALEFKSYLRPSARPLFFSALALGLSSSIYWTFAVDLIVTAGELKDDNIAAIFWTCVGIFGVFGALVGDFLAYFPLNFMKRYTMWALALSLFLLAFNPSSWLGIFLSAILFGSGFIILTGLIAIWSVKIYNDRPSVGHGVSLFLICFGQLFGPLIAGIFVSKIGLPIMFYLSALLAIIASFLGNTNEVKTKKRNEIK